jgi:hypothetical protein
LGIYGHKRRLDDSVVKTLRNRKSVYDWRKKKQYEKGSEKQLLVIISKR